MEKKKIPRVSVVIPVRNRKIELSRCLTSVLDQTFDDYEVIVVDNGSTDGTIAVIEKYARHDPRVVYFNEPKKGIGSARHSGEKVARGNVVLMTDSDCEVPRNWIERMSSPVLEGSIHATQGLKHAIRKNYWSLNVEREEGRLLWSFFERNGTSKVDTANFCIDRKVLKYVGYTDRERDQLNDTELAARILDKGYRVALLDVSVGHHNPLTSGTVARKLIKRGAHHSILLRRYPDNPVFEHHTLKIFLIYVIGLASEALKGDRNFIYDLVSGMSWRLGLLWGKVWIQR